MPADENTTPLNTPVDTNNRPDPGLLWKLVLHGDGSNFYARFDPQLLIKYEWSGAELTGRIPASGKGTSALQGSGEFLSRQPATFLSGLYSLEIGQTEARLYDGHEQIWFGKGTQEGLEGKTVIEFKDVDPA